MKNIRVIGLVILALASAIVSAVYLTKKAGNLPHFYPGYLAGSTHMHYKHGIAFGVLALLFLLGAWMLSGTKEKTIKKAKPETDDQA